MFVFVAVDDSIGYAQRTHFTNGDGTNNVINCAGTMEANDETCTDGVIPDSKIVEYHYEILNMFQRATGRPELKGFVE